jgi:thiol-disulfide isomerase/thioredoxin
VKKAALIGIASAIVVVLVVVLAPSPSSMTKKGSVGPRTAEACSETDPGDDCLPPLDFMGKDGTVWTKDALAGKVVMVNFWATWCRPCQTEIPALTATYHRHADAGFVLLGVMMDSDDVSDEELDAFAKRYNLDYPVVPLDGDIWREFGAPDALPTTLIYDRTGKLRLRQRGALSEASLRDDVEELLAEPAPGA